ncbi:MAG: hypothetical protein U0168_07775 [Nannocystaceae bacterium]
MERVERAVSQLLGLGGAGCIHHDSHIHIEISGFKWCGIAGHSGMFESPDDGAWAYDVDPGDGVPIKTNNLETPPSEDYPMDCACFKPRDDEKLQGWYADAPATFPGPMDADFQDFNDARTKIQDEVYNHCFNVWTNAAEYSVFGNSSCTSWSFDPNILVWRNSEVGGAHDCVIDEDIGYAEDTGAQAPEVTCVSQGHCTITSGYADDVLYNLWIATHESTYGTFVGGTSPGLKLNTVARSDVTYALGFRTNDVLVSVNGYSLNNLANVQAAMLALDSATSFTFTLKRGSSTLTYVYTIV